jgi:subtilase family serine protease
VRSRAAVGLALAALVWSASFASAGQAARTPSRRATLHRACDVAAAPRTVRCFAEWRASRAIERTTAGTIGLPESGYGPADIADAYRLHGDLGAGSTVAIVDAFDDPNVEADLGAYRRAWGLPACTTANGCFRKVNQRGGSTPPSPDPGWGVEISLDVQAVSAACPSCHILLVEARVPSLGSIGRAVNTAVRLGADVVSNSYGADEFTGVLGFGARYYDHPGIAQVAASGDFGFGTAQFPAVWTSVIAAGGTHLHRAADGSWTERAWWGAGSGCSAWVRKPAWQDDRHCRMQTVADVSAVADPNTGLAVYDTFGLGRDNGWIVVGGTSLSSPLIAGMIGRAGNAADLDSPHYLYRHRAGLQDVVGGSNGYCGGDYLCTGTAGYDAPTGLGSPRGVSSL